MEIKVTPTIVGRWEFVKVNPRTLRFVLGEGALLTNSSEYVIEVSGELRSAVGEKLKATTINFQTELNGALQAGAAPSLTTSANSTSVIGPNSHIFLLFRQRVHPVNVSKVVKVVTTSSLINKSILIFFPRF